MAGCLDGWMAEWGSIFYSFIIYLAHAAGTGGLDWALFGFVALWLDWLDGWQVFFFFFFFFVAE
jgi:hypothetical protein